MTDFRITVSSRLQDFADVWPSLADLGAGAHGVSGYPFQARDYIEAWLETMGAARGVAAHFVRVDRENGAPWLLAPLGIERRRGLRILGFLDGGVVDYAAPIVFPDGPEACDPRVLWRAIWAALPGFDITDLDKLAPHIGGVANPLFHLGAGDDANSGHTIPLDGTWDGFAKTRLPRAQTLRRKRRRLAEQGEVQFVIAESQSQRADFLAAMVRQKTRRYLETRGVDGFERPGYRAYFADLTERFAGGALHLSALTVKDEIVATHWGLVCGRRYYYLMPATEGGSWESYSVGNLLLQDLLQWSYANGYEAFDLGVGDEPYKLEFKPQTMGLARVVEGRSVLGRVAAPTWRALRHARARLRQSRAAPEAKAAELTDA